MGGVSDADSAGRIARHSGIEPVFAVRDRSHKRDRGFTLIEILLVLALLVVVGALTTPILTGTLAHTKLRNGGDIVRAALARTRLAAMESGQTQVFRCEMKGRRFQIGSLAELASANGEAPPAVAADEVDTARFDPKQLPGGVVFAAGQFAPSQQLVALLGQRAEASWSSPIVFQPDGTCTDATILLANEGQQTIRVTLRGVTGTVTVGDVDKEAVQ
ncbi:MAG: prepilin-type N-terminal cleavage/methylation domain-containing protein [Pirellulales bacterium]